jgi:hypothetical protein
MLTELTDTRVADPDAPVLTDIGHPRGTLAIVIVFGVLFAVGWFATYLSFMARGTTHH